MDPARQMRAVVAFVAVTTVGALVLGFLVGERPESPWIPVLVVGLSSLLLLLISGVAIWGLSRPVGDPAMRRRIRRAIRDGTELAPGEQTMAVGEAARLHRTGRFLPFVFAGCAVVNAVRLAGEISEGRPFTHGVVTFATMSGFAGMAAYQHVLRRRAGAYLSRFASSGTRAG
ncbi:hypothetical protein [Actinoplanes sp. NPDC049802]|uniref:hypothetical protein n=1 Tax=Actinoplanes sp. NPDC049802 TaxID=3154742 RepID=UPI0033F01EF8